MRKPTPQTLILTIWGAAAILAGSVLTSYHQPFTAPSGNLANLALPGHSWRAVHLLLADCGCSRKISDALAQRDPLPGLAEQIIFIGPVPDPFANRAALLARGFRVSNLSPDQLPGVKGAPLLLLVSPDGALAYAGGSGQSGEKDPFIWTHVKSGSSVGPFPVLGCAIGNRLRRQVDPLAWKYTEQ